MRPWQVALVFLLCLGLVLGVMAWLSVSVLRLDLEATRMRRESAVEENVRLALWRLDSTVSPLIGRESIVPRQAYRPFRRRSPAGELTPSPLLEQATPHVWLHFELLADGTLRSPEVPVGAEALRADPHLEMHTRGG